MLPGRESPLHVSAHNPQGVDAARRHDASPAVANWPWLIGATLAAAGLCAGAAALPALLQWPDWAWGLLMVLSVIVLVACVGQLMPRWRINTDLRAAGSRSSTTAVGTPAVEMPSQRQAPVALVDGLPGLAWCLQAMDGDWSALMANAQAQRALDAAALPALPQRLSSLRKAWPEWSLPLIDRLGSDFAGHPLSAPSGGEQSSHAGQVRWLKWSDTVAILWIQAREPEPAPLRSATEDDREAMAYAVSHDLRAPIRVVEGFTRIVREDYGHLLDRVGNDHLERVLGAAARMNSMIDALLALSRLSTQDLQRQKVSLSDLAQQVIDELRMPSPMRAVETRIAPDVVVQGDPTLLHCLMENLLANAWKYSARRELARIEFGATERDGKPVYFVRDNGAGFDMRFADRLFGAFQRLHSASEFQGTGVGLASVQRIVRRHGGKVWAEAAVNAGATFYFTLG